MKNSSSELKNKLTIKEDKMQLKKRTLFYTSKHANKDRKRVGRKQGFDEANKELNACL